MHINKQLMKAIIYCRVSTEEQVNNYSLGSQEKACKEYAEKNGMEVLQVFVEEGESAKFIGRTKLTELLEYCNKNKGQVDVLLVYKLDRFARSQQDHQAIRALLGRNGVTLRSVTEPIDDTSTGKLMEGILASFAQLDNDVRSERTTQGMKERLKSGYWAFGAPLGYKTIAINGLKNISPDERSAPLIRRAFEEYETGNSNLDRLATFLHKLGLKTKSGYKIRSQTLSKILSNKLYAGIIYSPEWDIEVKGRFEAIITEELFNKVQLLRSAHVSINTKRIKLNPDFPLRRTLVCPECSSQLTGSWSKGKNQLYAYYHCPNDDCSSKSIPKANVENSYMELLKSIQPEEAYIKLFKEAVRDVWQGRHREKFAEVKRLEGELNLIRELKDGLIEQNARGILDDVDFKEKIKKVNNEITIKEIHRNEARNDEVDIELILGVADTLMNNVSTLWLEAPLEDKVKFQQLLFPKGVIYKDGIIGTPEIGLPFSIIQDSNGDKSQMVTPAGLEPAISWMKTKYPNR